MKNKWLQASISFVCLGVAMQIAGCAGGATQDMQRNNRGYIGDSGRKQDNAVNTLQAESKYSIVTPKSITADMIIRSYRTDNIFRSALILVNHLFHGFSYNVF